MDKLIIEFEKKIKLLEELHWFTKEDEFLKLISDYEETIQDLKEIAESNQIVVTAAMSMIENVENNFRSIYEDYKKKMLIN